MVRFGRPYSFMNASVRVTMCSSDAPTHRKKNANPHIDMYEVSAAISKMVDKEMRKNSFHSFNAMTPLVRDMPQGIDYDAMTPLFRRVTEKLFEDDWCYYHNMDAEDRYAKYYYNPEIVHCTCNANNRLNYTQALVSVSGNASRVKPHEAVFVVRILGGVSCCHEIFSDLANIDNHPVVEFSVSDNLNIWDESPHFQYVKKYLSHCTDAHIFEHFHGMKAAKCYVLAFDDIVKRILSTPSAVMGDGKTNPHVGRKLKK